MPNIVTSHQRFVSNISQHSNINELYSVRFSSVLMFSALRWHIQLKFYAVGKSKGALYMKLIKLLLVLVLLFFVNYTMQLNCIVCNAVLFFQFYWSYRSPLPINILENVCFKDRIRCKTKTCSLKSSVPLSYRKSS